MFATLILCVTETYCKFTKTQIKPKCVIGTGLRLAVVAVNFVGFPVSGRSDIYIYIYIHTHTHMYNGNKFSFTNRSTTHTNSATAHNLPLAFQTRNKLRAKSEIQLDALGCNMRRTLSPVYAYKFVKLRKTQKCLIQILFNFSECLQRKPTKCTLFKLSFEFAYA